MHEYSLVQSLLEQVESQARAHRATSVTRLEVKIGEMAGVETELLQRAFECFREGTVCNGAALSIIPVPAEWICPGCDAELPRGARLQCPACGRPARLRGGDEIVLERIEMEVPHV